MSFGDFMNTSRRTFFKVTLLGSAVLLLGTSFTSVLAVNSPRSSSAYKYNFLLPLDIELLTALAPAILKKNYTNALDDNAQFRFITTIDKQIAALDQHSKKQLRQLFELLTISSFRFLAGVPKETWPKASINEVDSFLNGWKNSMFSLKRTGYAALVKLVTMSWYCQAENYQQAGYPGPPKIFLPQE
jgi:hypothetical protein